MKKRAHRPIVIQIRSDAKGLSIITMTGTRRLAWLERVTSGYWGKGYLLETRDVN